MAFLPMNIKEVKARGWDEVDFVYVMGDSYVDHPSFGAAIIYFIVIQPPTRYSFVSNISIESSLITI